jgi:S1-C subfamily serine protease
MTKHPVPRQRGLSRGAVIGAGWAALLVGLCGPAQAWGLEKSVLEAEKKRVAAIKAVRPAVVAVITGGGSGVLIDPEGYALTNFHVTSAARTPTMKCGLDDGVTYDAVLVGEDKVGDVALIKLLPPADKPGFKFPFAKLGDSDKVKAGDWSLAMGNPFMLSTDFTPTVTFGLISGVHRYQHPAGILLEYTDCIQIDTSINPGNSGGPLFNMDGELIGINGRGSFEKRGRVNSGVGYAISINQIKNFLGQLRVGMDTDHASLGARVKGESEEGALARVLVQSIIDSDARRRGLDVGDQLIRFAGRPVTSDNQYKNVLGLFPRGWRIPLSYRRESERKDILVRLMGIQRQELEAGGGPPPRPGPAPAGPPAPAPSGPAAKLYKARTGFSNYYFNELAQKQLLDEFKKNGDFSTLQGDWKLDFKSPRGTVRLLVEEKGAADGKSVKLTGDFSEVKFSLEPLGTGEKEAAFKDPPDSGGWLLAMYQYRQLLAFGPKGFVGEFSHGGAEPLYPTAGEEVNDWSKLRVDCDVLRTKHAGVPGKWYFAQADDPEKRWQKGQLIGFEVSPDRDGDPCEVYLSHYNDVGGGRKLPSKMTIRYGDKQYASFSLTKADLK